MDWEAVVLAAGESARLGRPKQLLEWEGEPLVRRAARIALAAGARRAVVVVGAQAGPVRAALAGLDLCIVEHPDWRRGMGSSIACGARACTPGAPILVTLADQPAVDVALLVQLVEAARAGAQTVACRYASTTGVPALFSAPHDLEVLRSMEGDRGAKSLLQHPAVHRIETDAPAHDIDVEDDWERWCARHAVVDRARGAGGETA